MQQPSHDSDAADAPVASPTLSARTFIIGFVLILAATAIFSLAIALKVRRDAVAMSDQLRLVGQAMVAYSSAHGAFPPDRAALEAFVARGGFVEATDDLDRSTGQPSSHGRADADAGRETPDRVRAALERVSIVWPALPGEAPQVSAGGRPVRHGVSDEVRDQLAAEAARLAESRNPAIP